MYLDTDALRHQMKVKYMNGRSLAEATGLTRQTIYRFLRGENDPRPENLKKICEALECSPEQLLKRI